MAIDAFYELDENSKNLTAAQALYAYAQPRSMQIKEQTPQGNITLDIVTFGESNGLEGKIGVVFGHLDANTQIPPHYHGKTTARVIILEGTGEFRLGEQNTHYESGTYIDIPPNVMHGIIAATPTNYLAIQTGRNLVSHERLCDTTYES
jgi:quercetin dioxygenase-like cupin family protein